MHGQLKHFKTAIAFLDLAFLFTISYSNKIKILFPQIKDENAFKEQTDVPKNYKYICS